MTAAARMFLRSYRRRVAERLAVLLVLATWGCLMSLLSGCSKDQNSRAGSGSDAEITVEIHECGDLPLPQVEYAAAIPAQAPRRIASLIPSTTETLFALGLGNRVIAVDRWADFPPAVDQLPRCADIHGVQVEVLITLKPDLILLFAVHHAAADLLRAAGLRVLIPPTESAEDIWGGVRAVSDAAGVPERGRELEARLRADLEEVRRKYSGGRRPRVAAVFERQPTFSVATRSSFIHAMIEIAGGDNVSAALDDTKHFVYIGLERLIDLRPEVIIDLTAGTGTSAESEAAQEFWKKAWPSAVRVAIPRTLALTRPGPRLGAATTLLAKLIHGR